MLHQTREYRRLTYRQRCVRDARRERFARLTHVALYTAFALACGSLALIYVAAVYLAAHNIADKLLPAF